ncbi:flagellar filament capping protein FliD [Pseudomonas kermanshahensis]|uniref:Flagellar hook-associated protein 2 n=1 Tax=Pseudomonas kermanshahensis TaxID=2745482 RepID=A0ABU8R8Z8_9PSED|nr:MULTISPECIES: flagellar filament capping protein FliD [Pseudomonas]MBC3486313.1 flagellar filament capping protein FliD [Pseudomonas sp. SWRI50]WEL54183.1 flagellar filament capping protein FliD [Pseudomonas kermanshahensis]SMF03051.1 flagellar hook-associated protein 2 [Pseudomonas sp. LAIL14HWK12:I11]SMR72448.1 flagellar hook-associated protein 2 [Pseudomonas sp. LAIL14HWK12:I10]SOD01356.1 flagellar hook-associated protein 2 [Pseudomonas sp. LAIL14HWK12:I8]
MASSTITGLGSGLKIDELVAALAGAEKAPKQTQINNQTATATTTLSAIGTIKSALETYRAALTKLNTAASFNGLSGSSSDEAIAKIKLGDGASSGTYSLEVTQLATASKISTQVYKNTSTIVNDSGESQTLTISQGNATHNVSIAAGATLQQARDSINDQLQSKGITANIVTDASGSRLIFSSTKMGDGTELTLGGTADMATGVTTIAEPQNAKYKLDGLELESASNTVTGAVSGVDITLVKEGKSSLVVASNNDTLKTSVQSFVTAYNALMTTINAQTKVTTGADDSSASGASLTGDATMRSLVSSIRSELTRSVGTGGLRTLSQLGINTVQKTGLLELNNDKWDAAVKTMGADISGLFVGKEGLLSRMTAATEEYAKTGGILASRQASLTTQLKQLEESQTALDRRIESLTDTLTKKYNAMDTLVAKLKATSDSVMTTLNALNKSNSDD